MLFKDLNLEVDKSSTEIDFNGHKIKVDKYIPINDKYDLILTTLDKCGSIISESFYDRTKILMYFPLHLIYMYSDLEFTEEDRMAEDELFDKLHCSGLMEKILNAIPTKEFQAISELLKDEMEVREKTLSQAGHFLTKLIDDLPGQMESASRIIDKFDPEKYEQVKQFYDVIKGGQE